MHLRKEEPEEEEKTEDCTEEEETKVEPVKEEESDGDIQVEAPGTPPRLKRKFKTRT